MKTYTTKSGDTWDSIAYNLYGDETHITELIACNRQYAHICVFTSGYVLIVPDINVYEDEDETPDWRS